MSHLKLKVLGIIDGVSFVVFKKYPSNIDLVIANNIKRYLGLSTAIRFHVLGKISSYFEIFQDLVDNKFNLLI